MTAPVESDGSAALREEREHAAGPAAVDPLDILDAADVPIVALRSDLTVARFNRAAAHVLGLRPSDVDRSPRAIPALAAAPTLERWCALVVSSGMASQHDFRAADRSFVVRIAPRINADRRTNGAVLTFTNVTAFRASLDQAIYEREYTKAILNAVTNPIVVLNADLHMQSANRAFYAMFGVSRETTQGVALRALNRCAFDHAVLQARLQETLTDDRAFEPFEIDCDLPEVGHRTVIINACSFILPSHPGRLAALSFQDVTERKRNEEKAQRLAAIVESSSDAIVSKSLGGMITSWNRAAERLFGYTAEEITGKTMMMIIPPDRQQEEYTILEGIRRGQSIEHFETVRRRKDGSLIEVSLSISPVKDTAGNVVGASKIARDITERRRADEHAMMLGREIDHRSKNLLAVVQATVQLTQAGTVDDLKKVIGGRIKALSNAHTLLAQSRWTSADLRGLVTEELSPFCPEGSRADIDGPDLSLEPQSAQSIAMLLHELTTNAVKYGALSVPAGRVQIAWSRTDGGLVVLRWSETGGPLVKPPTRRGFGSRVIDQIVRTQLHGEARFDWRRDGLWCEIEFRPSECCGPNV
jgi:PAS domain S-box-containing protein